MYATRVPSGCTSWKAFCCPRLLVHTSAVSSFASRMCRSCFRPIRPALPSQAPRRKESTACFGLDASFHFSLFNCIYFQQKQRKENHMTLLSLVVLMQRPSRAINASQDCSEHTVLNSVSASQYHSSPNTHCSKALPSLVAEAGRGSFLPLLPLPGYEGQLRYVLCFGCLKLTCILFTRIFTYSVWHLQ